MNQCPVRLKDLPCSKQGYGYLSDPVRPSDTELRLMKGHGAFFPELRGDEFFFIMVEGCNGCCEQMRVTARHGDRLTVERGSGCDCINFNARVSYDKYSKEYVQAAAREIGLNVKSPLMYDCETNTLSVDCNQLATDSDCGCGRGGSGETTGSGGGGRGPQGVAGRDGKDGLGVASIDINNNVLTWKDSKGNVHTIGTITAVAGAKGDKGERGDTGPAGPAGPEGADAGTITTEAKEDGSFDLVLMNGEGERKVLSNFRLPVSVKDATVTDNGKLQLTLTDGTTTVTAGDVVGPQGEKGEKGDDGVGYSVAIRNNTVYVAGKAGSQVRLVPLANAPAASGPLYVIPDTGLLREPTTQVLANGVAVVLDGRVVAIG